MVSGEEDIFQSLQILLATSLDERVMQEDYGCNLRDYLFAELDQIVNLCKRRGFVYPSAEIYGGFRSSYDYGPLRSLMLRNVREAWIRTMVQQRDDVVLIDAHECGSAASGRNGGFMDASLTHGLGNAMARWPDEIWAPSKAGPVGDEQASTLWRLPSRISALVPTSTPTVGSSKMKRPAPWLSHLPMTIFC